MADFDPAREYAAGFVGASYNPQADEELSAYVLSHGGNPDGKEVARQWGFEGRGEGELTLNFRVVEEVWGKDAMPGPAQTRGDCVSHAAKNAGLFALSHEVYNRKADEVSGKIEGKPEVPAEGVRQGVLSSDAIYHFRDHPGDGWWCHAAAQRMIDSSGLVLRKDYPDLKLDLTRYDGTLAGKYYAKRPPPAEWSKMYQEHSIRTATKLESPADAREFLAAANGGLMICSSLGFSKTRNEDGYSPQQGSWAHAMTLAAYDHRDETREKYGDDGLVLILNSWGSRWNSGPRRIRGTSIDIPLGSFWAKASLLHRTSMIAVSAVNGWPVGKLPDYGASGNV